MKRFKFRLEKVLNFRTVEKKERERELAFRNMELHNREERLAEILDAQDKSNVPGGPLTMAEFALHSRYQEALRRSLERQRDLVQEAIAEVEKAREAYLEKAVETKTLETLKDRRKDEHKEEARREERGTIDEIVIQRHGKSR